MEVFKITLADGTLAYTNKRDDIARIFDRAEVRSVERTTMTDAEYQAIPASNVGIWS